MLILAVHSGWVVYTSSFRQSVGSEMFRVFVVTYIGIAIVLFVLGGLFAWLTDKGKIWAKWVFMAYCTYRAVDSVWGAYWREVTIASQTYTLDWVKSAIFALIWLFLVGLAWRARPNKGLKPTSLPLGGLG